MKLISGFQNENMSSLNRKLILVFIVASLIPVIYFRIEEWMDGLFDSWWQLLESLLFNSLISIFVTLVIAWVILNVLDLLNKKLPWSDKLLYRLLAEVSITFPIAITLGYILGNLIYYISPFHNQIYNDFIFGFISISVIMNFILVAISDWFYFFNRWKISLLENERKLKENEVLEKEKIASQYEVLKNQINPHFLFNSLNTLASLIHTDPIKAEHFVEEFAELYRYILDHNKKDLVSLGDELDIVKSYSFLQKERFGNSLLVEIESDNDDLSKVFVFPLSIQTLVENAIKHNSCSAENPLKIKITVSTEAVTVTNKLQPKVHVKNSTGIGIKNLTNRYKRYLITPEFYKNETNYIAKLPLIREP